MGMVFVVVGVILLVAAVVTAVVFSRMNRSGVEQEEPQSRIHVGTAQQTEAAVDSRTAAELEAEAEAERKAEAARAAEEKAAAEARAAEQAKREEHERQLAERAAAQRAALEERRRAAQQAEEAAAEAEARAEAAAAEAEEAGLFPKPPAPLPTRKPGATPAGAAARAAGEPTPTFAPKGAALPRRGENKLAQAEEEEVTPVRPVPQGAARGRIGDFRPRR